MRPRVVFLSKRFLYPLDTGGKIRTAKLLEKLRQHWQITLVGHFEPETDTPWLGSVEALAERFVSVPKPRPAASGGLRLGSRFHKLVSPQPLAALYDTDAALRQAVAQETSRGAELVVCDFVQSSLNLPEPPGCASMLFTHNVEARILRRHAEVETGWKTWFWALQRRRMSRFEARECARYDRVVAVSDSDREELEQAYGLANVRTIPTGVDTSFFQPGPEIAEPDLVVFCGSMDWPPNLNGVAWFAEKVLPSLRASRPSVRFQVVGRRPPEDFVKRYTAKGVELTGFVEDVRPYLRKASAIVVPLLVGGGTRIKIYEAMAMELPVVSTGIGAEGLPLEDLEHYRRADSPEAFAAAVLDTLDDRERALKMAARARRFVEQSFSWEQVARVFAKIGEEAMAAFARREGRGQVLGQARE